MSDLGARITEGRTICTRCGAALGQYSTDTCVWCRQSLCPDCWTKYGDCGHPELVELDRRRAERRRMLRARRENRWTIPALARFYEMGLRTATNYTRLFCLGTRDAEGRLKWLSPQDAQRFGEALKIRRARMDHKLLYRPPWPEWLRQAWTEAGYTEPPLKP